MTSLASWNEARYRSLERLYWDAIGLLDEVMFYGPPVDLEKKVSLLKELRKWLIELEEETRP